MHMTLFVSITVRINNVCPWHGLHCVMHSICSIPIFAAITTSTSSTIIVITTIIIFFITTIVVIVAVR